MKGLIKESEQMIEEDASPEARDAGLIACAQRVEHYEIADLLAVTLDEEKGANEKLNDLAIEGINAKAM